MRDSKRAAQDRKETVDSTEAATSKRSFAEPRLEYVKPTLVRHGRIEKVTAGFFGQFYP